jgi:SAM-dependent methyltransferase
MGPVDGGEAGFPIAEAESVKVSIQIEGHEKTLDGQNMCRRPGLRREPKFPNARGQSAGPDNGTSPTMVPRLWNVPPDDTGIQEHRDEGRRLFGLDPTGYRAGRPDYPEAVYETLVQRCGLGPTTRTLEIGPGTGLVTRHLLRRGAHVTAVEPDHSMASYLCDTAASVNLDVVIASFEDADVAQGSFDLAVAATSFHWVDQEIGLTKLGWALRPGGWVALWWTLFRDPAQPDEFSQALDHILGPVTRGAFDEPGRPPFQLDELHRRRDMTRWAGLVDVTSQVIPWTCEMTPVQARALYASMATVIRLPPDDRRRILDGVERLATDVSEGIVRRRFVSALYTGRRQ